MAVKPSNVLIELKDDEMFGMVDWCLTKITNFESSSKRSEDYTEFVSQNLQFQESLKQVILSASTVQVQAVYQKTGRCFCFGSVGQVHPESS